MFQKLCRPVYYKYQYCGLWISGFSVLLQSSRLRMEPSRLGNSLYHCNFFYLSKSVSRFWLHPYHLIRKGPALFHLWWCWLFWLFSFLGNDSDCGNLIYLATLYSLSFVIVPYNYSCFLSIGIHSVCDLVDYSNCILPYPSSIVNDHLIRIHSIV